MFTRVELVRVLVVSWIFIPALKLDGIGLTNSWWNHKVKGNIPTFLFQQSTFPFAYPSPSEANEDGDIVISYPTDLTARLQIPLTKAMCKTEGIYPYVEEPRVNARKRKAACNEVAAQAW